MSFHEELNQKLNVFFNRDWFVELSEQEEEKMEELAAGLVKDFGWDTVFHTPKGIPFRLAIISFV